MKPEHIAKMIAGRKRAQAARAAAMEASKPQASTSRPVSNEGIEFAEFMAAAWRVFKGKR